MAKILVIGDSISMGYTPVVREQLAGVAEVEHNPDNGGDSVNVLANVEAWLAATRPDFVSLNCGLHDIKRARTAPPTYQVPLDRYKANLDAIIDRITLAGCPAVWVSTTPVIEVRHQASRNFDRYNADVAAYNRAARAIAEQAGLPVIDLHRAAIKLGLDRALGDDGVHFTSDGYAKLGSVVAAAFKELVT